MKYLFQGWITKNWKDINESQSEPIAEINTILVRHSIEFYTEAQKERNTILHDPEYYKEYVMEQYYKVKNLIEHKNRPEMKKYLRNYVLNVNQCDVSYVQNWILGVLKMRKITKTGKENDIRQFFVLA